MDGIETPQHTAAGAGGVSAVSWGAILAGTAVAAGTSLLLFALAAGLDLASISAWPRRGASAASVTAVAAIALITIQWISACLGGYITGRLRTSWVGTHTHEVFFRDTAHGFITWCVATVVLASGVVSPASSFVGAALRAGTAPASRPAPANLSPGGTLDAYPRGGTTQADLGELAVAAVAGPRAQDGLIVPAAGVAASVRSQLVRGRFAPLPAAPLAIADCGTQQRFDVADEAADAKDAATSSILTALSMLIGAFIASAAAALGGRLRDAHP